MKAIKAGTYINDEYLVKKVLDVHTTSSSFIVTQQADNKNYFLKIYKTKDISDINFDVKFHDKLPVKFEYRIYKVGTYEGCPFFVRNFYPGQTLEDYVENVELKEAEIFAIFQNIYKKVHMLHKAGGVHFDIKPSNIIVSKTNGYYDTKLIDFNCVDPLELELKSRQIVSTLQFAAPEFILAKEIVHPFMCDYYSLGAVLFYMLFKSPPMNPIDLGSYVAALKQFDLEEHLHAISDARIVYNLRNLLHRDPADRHIYSYVNNILPMIAQPRKNFDAETYRILTIIKHSKLLDLELLHQGTSISKERLDDVLNDLSSRGVIDCSDSVLSMALEIDLPQQDLLFDWTKIVEGHDDTSFLDYVLVANCLEVAKDFSRALYYWQKALFSQRMKLCLQDRIDILVHIIRKRSLYQLTEHLHIFLLKELGCLYYSDGEFRKSFYVSKLALKINDERVLGPSGYVDLAVRMSIAANASQNRDVALDTIRKVRRINKKIKGITKKKRIEYAFRLNYLKVEISLFYLNDISLFEFIKLFSFLRHDFLKKCETEYALSCIFKSTIANLLGLTNLAKKYQVRFVGLRNDMDSGMIRAMHYHNVMFPNLRTTTKPFAFANRSFNKAYAYFSSYNINPYFPIIALHMSAFVNAVRGNHGELFASAKQMIEINFNARTTFFYHSSLYMDYFSYVLNARPGSQVDSKNRFAADECMFNNVTERAMWSFLKMKLCCYENRVEAALHHCEVLSGLMKKNISIRAWYGQFLILAKVEVLLKGSASNIFSRERRLVFYKQANRLKSKIIKFSQRVALEGTCYRLIAKYELLDLNTSRALEYLELSLDVSKRHGNPLDQGLAMIDMFRILKERDIKKSAGIFEEGYLILKKNRLNLLCESLKKEFVSLGQRVEDRDMKIQERLILDKIKQIQEKTSVIKDEKILLQEILDTAIETLNGERGILILRNKDNPEAYDFAMARDCFKNSISDYSANISRNILYNASLSADPTILEDAALADDFSHYKSVRVNRLKSVLAIPLIYKGVKKGILYIDNNEIPGIFNEDIIELAKHFAISVCAVLENLERVTIIEKLTTDVEQINQKFIDSSELFTLGKIHPLTMHDLKSYLSYILFGIDDLREELVKRFADDDEYLNEIIERLKNSVSVINKHINSNNALVSRGRTLELETLASDNILDDIKEFIEPFSMKDKIKVSFVNNIENQVYFLGNRYLLNNVFINIIINALDALKIPMEEEKLIQIDTEATEYSLRFRFSNNGPAIDDEIKEKIFSPFTSSKSSSASNSGLGLYISEKIMEYHKGEIFLDDEHEMTSFVIELSIYG